MLIAPKWLKLRTSNMTCMFPATVWTWLLKIFEKGASPGSCNPLNFWVLNANISKMVKGMDFKFDMHVPRDSPDTICTHQCQRTSNTDLLAWWAFWHELQLQDEFAAESSDSELLLDDEASLELSDVNIVGLVRSTDSATLASSGRFTYIIHKSYLDDFFLNKQGSFITVVLSTASAAGNTCVQYSFNFCIFAFAHRRLYGDVNKSNYRQKCKLSTEYQEPEMNEGNGHQLTTILYLHAKFLLQSYCT